MSKGLGLVIKNDIRNERYLLRDQLNAARALATGEPVAPAPFVPRSVKWRAYWWGDQGNTPRCGPFGLLHLLADGPVSHRGQNPLTDPEALYQEIRAEDRRRGYDFAEGGVTSVGVHETARRNGWYGAYYWGYTLSTAHEGIARAPIAAGTNWYSSMFERDAEGIVRITPSATVVGGHFYILNGYDARRGLWRIHQTWGDGYYYLPDEDFYRLVRENGEFAIATETPGRLPPLRQAA